MPYKKTWGSTTPGCVIFLLDRSGSMSEVLGEGTVAEGQRLDTLLATQLNKCIKKMGDLSIKGNIVSSRVEIAVIGYGGSGVASLLEGHHSGRDLVSITDLMEKPLRIDERPERRVDDSGAFYDKLIRFPVWVDPVSSGGTPMCEALRYAERVARDWSAAHSDCFPPLVINITDGIATDGDPREAAAPLRTIETSDGSLLLFNCHISAMPGKEIAYPVPGVVLPTDEFDSAAKLFEMSSEIPEPMRAVAQSLDKKLDLPPGARGFLFNADLRTVAGMLVFSTTPAATAPDPNM